MVMNTKSGSSEAEKSYTRNEVKRLMMKARNAALEEAAKKADWLKGDHYYRHHYSEDVGEEIRKLKKE